MHGATHIKTYHLFTTKNLSVTEMGSARSTSGEEETRIQGFYEKFERRNHLEDTELDGRMILNVYSRSGYGEHGLDRSALG
jgi:uncharacterized protein YgiB involved in biofilm formation